jgi:hypothetical protein
MVVVVVMMEVDPEHEEAFNRAKPCQSPSDGLNLLLS